VQVGNVEEAVDFVNARPKPLALYVFGTDAKLTSQIVENTSSGGVCVNDTIMHMTDPSLPFGGVGHSGMGAYHGKRGFDAFTHEKSVLERRFAFDVKQRYAPYSEANTNFTLKIFGIQMSCVRHGRAIRNSLRLGGALLVAGLAALFTTKYAYRLW
jgi:aldehyde dehydrogenase (NAD+)